MKRKLKGSAGFSLTEMLCAVAVLMLLCVMLNSGLSAAMKTYFDITAESGTQLLLLNSLTNAIAGELRYAYEVSGSGSSVTYNDKRRLYLDTSDGQVYVQNKDGEKMELLPKEKAGTRRGGAYKNGEYLVESMTITPNVEKDAQGDPVGCYFTLNLEVGCKNSDIGAEAKDVVIRCLNPPEKEGGGDP